MPDPVPAPVPVHSHPARPIEGLHGEPRVVVRPLPKVIFFYLTWIVSLVGGLLTMNGHAGPEHLGTIWMIVFAFNLIVISFDFTEVVSIAVLALILMTIFAGLYFGFLSFLGKFIGNLDVVMNDGFYFSVFGLFTVIYLLVFIKSRFEYWESASPRRRRLRTEDRYG